VKKKSLRRECDNKREERKRKEPIELRQIHGMHLLNSQIERRERTHKMGGRDFIYLFIFILYFFNIVLMKFYYYIVKRGQGQLKHLVKPKLIIISKPILRSHE